MVTYALFTIASALPEEAINLNPAIVKFVHPTICIGDAAVMIAPFPLMVKLTPGIVPLMLNPAAKLSSANQHFRHQRTNSRGRVFL